MIGIHDRPGSFSDRWFEYCTEKAIPFRRVNCLATDVIQQCGCCEALLWHWAQCDPPDQLVARQVIAALEASGLMVFPNVATCWHFDDKVAQKYLLEAIDAPLIPTWVFTKEEDALQWIRGAAWPKVFKLRCGAASANVRLVRDSTEAETLCRRAFGRGFPSAPGYFTDMRTRVRQTQSAQDFWNRLARAPRTLLRLLAVRRQMQSQRGYIYFQEFVPGNDFDTRITVVGKRAFGFLRANRPGDFRASGSGRLVHAPGQIDFGCVQVAFEVAERVGAQSLAFDFLHNERKEPLIGEISYGYTASAIHACPGFWEKTGQWHEGRVWPQDAILEDLLAEQPAYKRRTCTHV